MAPVPIDDAAVSGMSAVVVLASVGSVVSLVLVVALCLCCYRRSGSDSDSDYDELDKQYVPINSQQRSDLKQLNRHPWHERMDSRPAPYITRKSIKFERPPDKEFEAHQVQPNQYSQSSLNRTLGVRNKHDVQNANLLSTVREEESVKSSPKSSPAPSPYRDRKTALARMHTLSEDVPSSGPSTPTSRIPSPFRERQKLTRTHTLSEEGNSSSANSSPFHKVSSRSNLNSGGGAGANDDNNTGAMALDDLPIVEDPYYPPHPGEKLGKIQFQVSYDFQEMTLTLKIIRATELPAKDFSGTSDPYVKILLLPDKKSKLTTNIKRKNLNPRWNEVFAFEGFPYSKLMSRTLYLQVLDYDRFSRDDPIGEVCVPLSDLDLAQGQTLWRNLQPCKGHTGKLGELLLSLCYQPSVGRLTVVILKARELKAKDINGFSDPYVKIWLMHEGKKEEKKKTTTKEKNLNPVFNESFIFNVSYEKIRHTSLRISVMDYDRMGRNELIGEILLGSKSGPMEVKHWNEMFAKSRQPVAQWHILKDFG